MTELSGTLISIDGREALRFERHLKHDVERVWRAISAPDELVQWFVGTVAWTPAAGETFEVMEQTVTVTAVEPPRRLAWDWGEERYSFELTPEGDGTKLVFTHVFVTTYGPADQHAAGWETYFDRLDALLAGVPISEERAHDPIVEYHEAYVAKLGVDPAAGRRMIASFGFRDLTLSAPTTLRLERRYKHAPERLWRAITDPDELAAWFPELDQLEVVDADAPHRLVASWWGQSIRFELHPQGDGTRLVFEHDFEEPETSARTAAGWDRCFFALEALLAGHPVTREESLEHWPLVHERYAKTFGVDPELGRRAYADDPST